MKKLILLFTIIFVVQNAKGQIGTDLQFSQTLLKCVEITSPGTGWGQDTIVNIGTVPSGKIWKVVGTTTPHIARVQSSYFGYLYIIRNSTNQGLLLYRVDEDSNMDLKVWEANLPIYFNENEDLSLEILGEHGDMACVSIVEYTVVP